MRLLEQLLYFYILIPYYKLLYNTLNGYIPRYAQCWRNTYLDVSTELSLMCLSTVKTTL